MIKKKNKYQGYEIPFWGEWLDADLLKRGEMVRKLPFVREVANVGKLPKEIREDSISLMLNSFFENLESAVYIKINLENNKKKRTKFTPIT